MRFRQAVKSAPRGLLAVVVVCVALTAPLFVGNAALALFSFVPWFYVCRKLGRCRRPIVTAIAFGFIAGGFRAEIVCAPMLVCSVRPMLVIVLAFIYSGFLHAVLAVATAGLIRSERWWALVLTAATVPLFDAIWCAPPSLRVPYLTAVYLAAGSDGLLRLAPAIGTLGLAALLGFVGVLLERTLAAGNRAAGGVGCALVAVAILDVLVPFRPISESTPKLTVATVSRFLNWVEVTSSFQPPPSIIVLPEESVLAFEDVSISEWFNITNHLLLEDIRSELASMDEPPIVIAGVHYVPRSLGHSYMNRVVILDGKGLELWTDKRNPAPGGEITPLGDAPVIGGLLRWAAPVDGQLVPSAPHSSAGGVIRVGRWSLAIAICYDHSIPYSRIGWGVDSIEIVDLLVCVAKTEGLGRARVWEERLSERARRLSSAIFNCPLLYVTDSGSRLIYPCGPVYESESESDAIYIVSTGSSSQP